MSNSLDETFIETTYEAIFAQIAKVPLEKANIRLGTRVTKVYAPDSRDSGRIQVASNVLEDAPTFDEVIVTMPLGYLKSVHHESFSPTLPKRMSVAIDAISVGKLEKVSMP